MQCSRDTAHQRSSPLCCSQPSERPHGGDGPHRLRAWGWGLRPGSYRPGALAVHVRLSPEPSRAQCPAALTHKPAVHYPTVTTRAALCALLAASNSRYRDAIARGENSLSMKRLARAPMSAHNEALSSSRSSCCVMSSTSWHLRPRLRRWIRSSGSKNDTTGTHRAQACRKVFGKPSTLDVFTCTFDRAKNASTSLYATAPSI